MRITSTFVTILGTCLLGVQDIFAKIPPMPKSGPGTPPGPPGLPIDGNILTVLIIAVLFGVYIIYNHNLKTKTPV